MRVHQKRIPPASYLLNSEDWVLLHQADYYFSHLRKRRARKSCQGHRGKDRNIVEGELAPHADLIHAMHIQLFRLQQKHTSNHFLSNSVLPGLKMDPGPQKVCPGQCIWEELLVFEVPATVNNRFAIQTRTMLLFAASSFGKKSSK